MEQRIVENGRDGGGLGDQDLVVFHESSVRSRQVTDSW